jgi:hypothetical protein
MCRSRYTSYSETSNQDCLISKSEYALNNSLSSITDEVLKYCSRLLGKYAFQTVEISTQIRDDPYQVGPNTYLGETLQLPLQGFSFFEEITQQTLLVNYTNASDILSMQLIGYSGYSKGGDYRSLPCTIDIGVYGNTTVVFDATSGSLSIVIGLLDYTTQNVDNNEYELEGNKIDTLYELTDKAGYLLVSTTAIALGASVAAAIGICTCAIVYQLEDLSIHCLVILLV